MKTNLRFLAVATAILSVLSCTREIENIDREEASQTLHYVHFIADAPETKTNLEISQDGTVSYSWTAYDECAWTPEDGDCRWTITNKTNGETAQEITAVLTDGVLALTAGFSSEVKAGDVLFAQYNKSVSSTQNYVSEIKYHQESDVMISNEIVVQDGDNSNTDYYFSFKRRVAFAKMTLKGLNPNDYVSTVTIESDKAIAGTYNSETDSFDSNSSNRIVLNARKKIDENGTATIYFAVVPVEDANLTVTVETVTEEAAVANTYRKTFVRPISFVIGDVRAFGVACQRVSLEEIQLYSTEFNYTLSGSDYTSPNEIEGKDSEGGTSWGITYGNWYKSNCAQFRVYSSSSNGGFGSLYMKFDLPKVSRVSYKAKVKNSSTNVRLNTYYSVDSGKSWINVDDKKELTNSWTGYEFVVSSKGEYENVRVMFEASGSRNTSSTEELTIDDVVIYGVEYGAPKYNINIETVEGGELSATASSAKAGTEITLVANPDTGYNFNNDWLVKDSDGNEIPVVDEKFTMPAKDVTVTASFSAKPQYSIAVQTPVGGTLTADKESAWEGAEVNVTATAAEKYAFKEWNVTWGDKGETVSVVDNKFAMPAGNVNVSATFIPTLTVTPMNPTPKPSMAGEHSFIVETVATDWTVSVPEEDTWVSITKNESGFLIAYTANELETETTLKRSTTITVSSEQAEKTGDNAIKINFSQSGKEYIKPDVSYNLVKSVDELYEGMVFVIGCGTKNGAAGAMGDNVYLSKVDANITEGVLSSNSALEFTLGKSEGSWTLTSSEGVLGATAEKSLSSKNGTTTWNISIDASYNASITSTRSGYGTISYNSGSPRFLNYTSKQTAVQIYALENREAQSISYSGDTGSIDIYTNERNLPTLDQSGVKTSVKYDSSDETVATIDKNGAITALKAGKTTITATAVASDSYKPASTSFTLTVTNSTPYTPITFSVTCGSSSNITDGYTYTKESAAAKSGYDQDKSASEGLSLLMTKTDKSELFSTTPTSISITVKVGGGTTKNKLTNSVYAYLVDKDGKSIESTNTIITTKVETATGKEYTVSIPNVESAYGLRITHEKESGYNVRIYSISFTAN